MELVKFPGSQGPLANPETEAFWAAADQGRFVLPRCVQCHQVHWYPRAFCPFCHHAVEWFEASGRATLHSYSVVASPQGSYCLAYVKLEEGPLMMSNIVKTTADALRLELPVQVCFNACANGRQLPVFEPLPGGDA